MRIGILSNTDTRCGNAADARNLSHYLFEAGPCSVFISPVYDDLLKSCEVIIINWHPSVLKIDVPLVQAMKSDGKKVILMLQNSFDWEFHVADNDVLKAVDVVVAHEPMSGNVQVKYIPVGVPVVDLDNITVDNNKIGVAGFPFRWKRYDVVAEAAKMFGLKCCMITPSHPFENTDDYVNGIEGHIRGLAEIHREWLEEEEVIKLLAGCALNIFWYQSFSLEDQLGQTGSARLGIAAKRPMIISKHRKFRTLLPYTDDFYIADTDNEVYDIVHDLIVKGNIAKAKRPLQVYNEMSWPKCAEMFYNLILEITSEKRDSASVVCV